MCSALREGRGGFLNEWLRNAFSWLGELGELQPEHTPFAKRGGSYSDYTIKPRPPESNSSL